jgi:hypothetical protein
MSEFQHYYFRTIDKPLTAEEKKKVEGLSSHIDVSTRSAVVSYSYGSFKHDEEKVLEQYFDAMLFQTSWGQKKLMFRFPKDSVDYNAMKVYCIDGGNYTGYETVIIVRQSGNYTLLVVEYCDDDFEGWVEEKALDSLLDLRAQLMAGDFSCLYAFWLKILSLKEDDEDEDEEDYGDDEYELPALPFGLVKPSSALKSFIEFYDIDEKIVKAAASFIAKKESKKPDYQALIADLDEATKTQWLIRLVNEETLLDVKLKKYLTNDSFDTSGGQITFEQIMKKALGK